MKPIINSTVNRLKNSTVFVTIFSAALIVWMFLFGNGAAALAVEDAAITDAVEREFISDPAVPFDNIDVATVNGIVTLTGRVGNILARERAVKIARVVKGVKSVVDRIEMVPTFNRTDSQIEKDIEEAILFNPATETYEITVQVDAFEATLKGQVDSRREKILAETLAKGVKGVLAVNNKIRLRENQDRSDTAIMADVEQALKWNVLIDNGMIDVKVNNKIAYLNGSVNTYFEKARADRLASSVRGGPRGH